MKKTRIFTGDIKKEKSFRIKWIKNFCIGMELSSIAKDWLSTFLEVSMNDAYACGRLEKSKEVATQK